MPKRNLKPVKDEPLELEDFQDDSPAESGPAVWRRSPLWLRVSGGLLVVALLLGASFEFVYAGKVYPGVSADGVYLGGLSRTAAAARLSDKVSTYSGEVVTIANGGTNLRIPVDSLSVSYDTARAADIASRFGREGSLSDQIHQQLRALFGHATNYSVYHYDDSRLTPYLVELDGDIASPVQDASLNFNGDRAQVTPAQTGSRLDLGRLTQLINDRLSQTSTDAVSAPVYQLAPVVDTAPLQAAVGQVSSYLSGPVNLSYSGVDRAVDQKTIISWIQVSSNPPRSFLQTLKLADLYPLAPTATLGLSHDAVAAYVAGLAKGIDQTAQNAGLAMQNDQLTVVTPSHDGVKLDQTAAASAIIASLTKSGSSRHVNLKLQTTTAPVNENNLSSLGITSLISEGETSFPGSPSTRLINVRAGAARFNNVLLSPGQQFSFGALLGDVGPETGYVPELVILGDHEEKQYGGGLCQVSTTAFRAALLAGLPINERVNHAFAISYYTWPYGVPGVDATIYYPQVDFKFTNDTGHYILIQTIMSGTDLKFDFYGTKAKQGVVRGPTFVSGSNDPTQPSHTIFYRDVEDLTGKVIKTDTFNTYYKPSTDFPITKQFN